MTTGGTTDQVERDVELAIREWFSWIGHRPPGSVREHLWGSESTVTVEVAPDVVEQTRDRFRRLFLNRASRSREPIASLADVVDEARAWCTAWDPMDFAMFCWWVRCGSPEWAARSRGWQAKLLDAIADDVPHGSLSAIAFYAWKAVPNPQDSLLTGRWRELFRRGGYVEDSSVTQRPAAETLVLYRGSNWETRANWSWTSVYEIADSYHQRHGGPNAQVWVALVPRENVLARQGLRPMMGRLYDEYVVDTMRRDKPGWTIPIRPLDLPLRRAHWPHCRSGFSASFVSYRCSDCGAMIRDQSPPNQFETVTDAFLGRRPRALSAR